MVYSQNNAVCKSTRIPSYLEISKLHIAHLQILYESFRIFVHPMIRHIKHNKIALETSKTLCHPILHVHKAACVDSN